MRSSDALLPRRAAFVHIVKSGGMYVLEYLKSEIGPLGYTLHDIPSRASKEEVKALLARIAEDPADKLLLHHHSNLWPAESFAPFKANKWFTFGFVRHPGDLLCSFYHYSKINPDFAVKGSLDEFIRLSLAGAPQSGVQSLKLSGIPPYWREIDFLAPFNHRNFSFFLKKYFGIDYTPRDPVNVSGNQGYAYYCEEGLILPETRQMLEASEQYGWYREICARRLS